MKRFMYIAIILVVVLFTYIIFVPQRLNVDKTSYEYSKLNPKNLKTYTLEQKIKNSGRKPADHPGEAMQYEMELRSEYGKAFSYGPDWKIKAQKQAIRNNALMKTRANLEWVERGPGNIGGRTRSIIVHPQNPDIWWAAAVGGGVWQTTDGGDNWHSQTDDLPVLSATTIGICTNSPDVLYAGTGEGFYNFDAIIGDGIFKTIDGGQTWTQLSATASNYNFRYVNRVIVHPTNANIVLAATNNGVYRSTNGGESWTTVFGDSGRVQQIIANPLNFNTQFIAVNSRGIYKSTNMGSTWKYVSSEISGFTRVELAIASVDTNYLYASAAQSDGSLRGFYQSTDAGNLWTYLGNSPNWFREQGWYDNTLIVDPFDPAIVIAGGIDLYKVTVSGNSMSATQLSSWYGGDGLDMVHADQHYIAVIKDGTNNYKVIAANDGGIYYSENKGVNWQNKNNNFNVTQYYDGDRHPFRNQFIGGSQDNGTTLSPAETIFSDKWVEVTGGDGFDCAWDKENPKIIYCTLYEGNVYKSIDGGINFSLINGSDLPGNTLFHTPLQMDPHNSQKLFTASETNQVFYTVDGGETWNSVAADLGLRKIIKIRISKHDPSIVWAASGSSNINISTDGGDSFNKISKPSGAPDASLTGLETFPENSSAALITFGISGAGKIFKTTDLGANWQNITGNLPDVPVHCAAVMPYDGNEIWIGTDIGLFITYNGGESWEYANNGIPAASIRRLKVVGQEIVAVTHGRGVWSVFNDQLPEQIIPVLDPILSELDPPDPNNNRLKIKFMARGIYDSLQIEVNDVTVQSLKNVPVYQDTFVYYNTSAPAQLNVRILGYSEGLVYESDQKSIDFFEAVNGMVENFETVPDYISGDFLFSQESGFNSKTMHTEHNYTDKREYIALVMTPINIFDDSYLKYYDVALVEPGEPGKFYPDQQMWDYVTVEGSTDGENWDILIEPYDCRAQASWLDAYNNNIAGNASMFASHTIDLFSKYMTGEKIYLRFRLFADDYTTGWGWAIDNVNVLTQNFTNIEDGLEQPSGFELIGNYPNPFNPETIIKFNLGKSGLVSLKIYNNLGQLVRSLIIDQNMTEEKVIQVKWDGRNDAGNPVSSGTYFYRLTAGNRQAVKKMVLLR